MIIESLAGQLDSASGRAFLAIQRHRLLHSGGSWAFRSKTVRLIAAEVEAILRESGLDEQLKVERFRLGTQLVIHRLADLSREEGSGSAAPRTLVIETLVSAATSILTAEPARER